MTDSPLAPLAQLPSRPSLALLSNLAQQLRDAHRAGTAEAIARVKARHSRFGKMPDEQIVLTPLTLRDAQLVIAREFGFEHWAALKKHVLSTHDAGASRELVEAIMSASSRGDLKEVTRLLDEHPDLVNIRGGEGTRTALHRAAEKGHLAVVELLLDRGADPTIRDVGDNATALHFAAEKGDLGIIKRLVEFGADVDGFGDVHGWDVIGWATIHHQTHVDVANYLIECGAKHNIFSAVSMGDVEAVRRQAFNPDALDKPLGIWEHRRRPLHQAVLKRQPKVVPVLLEMGADPEAADIDGLTALDWAALSQQHEIAAILLDRGARVHLPAAFGLRRNDMIETLLRDAPDCLRPGHPWERLIEIAAGSAPPDVIESLLARGADVNVRVNSRAFGTKSYTPLHTAAWEANLAAIETLVKHGAQLEAEDDTYHGTPLGWARYNGKTSAVELLKSLGAKQ